MYSSSLYIYKIYHGLLYYYIIVEHQFRVTNCDVENLHFQINQHNKGRSENLILREIHLKDNKTVLIIKKEKLN